MAKAMVVIGICLLCLVISGTNIVLWLTGGQPFRDLDTSILVFVTSLAVLLLFDEETTPE
ncbi:MAG: hypothetical protein C4551_02310 [Bacillota bacterium]|nr:MAG: hypothetical protein C4551_02310 [Bacillota bacterium]